MNLACFRLGDVVPAFTRQVTLGGEKNYDTRDFVNKLREAAPGGFFNNHLKKPALFGGRLFQE